MQKKALLATAMMMALTGCSSPATDGSSQSSLQEKTIKTSTLESENSQLKQVALAKIDQLKKLMNTAEDQAIDTTRQETTIWFAKEFLTYADWDEANQPMIEKFFGSYSPFKKDKTMYAEMLPDFERQKVIEILEKDIITLERALKGEIKIRPAVKVDWENIELTDDMFLSQGKPVFLYDYFSKSMGNPTSDKRLYNDYLGNIDRVPSINPNLLNNNGEINPKRLAKLANHPDTKIGYALYWNSGFPPWINKKEPEVAKGRSLFTGFDIDNPLMIDLWGKIVRETAEVTKGKKSVQMGYILSNEPHWFSEKGHWTQRFKEMTEISSYTQNNFRQWLSVKYSGDIQQLNENWNTQHSNFDTLSFSFPMDRADRGKPIWYDWCRYNMDRSTKWFTYLQNELHSVNPEADTNIKIMPDLFTEENRSHGIDLEALTELTTMIGNDAKTMQRNLRSKGPEEWEAKYAYNWEELAVSYDFMESVAPNKIHVNSETHFLSSSWWRKLDTSTDYVRNTFWLSTLLGMDAGLSWFWARDPDGSPEARLEGKLKFFDPAMAGSYAASVAMQPQVANELTQVMMDLNTFSEEIMALRKQKRPIRLFYSETSAINKNHHMHEQFKLYESLFFEGFPVGYATKNIITKQDNTNWDAIVVYKTEYVTDAEFKSLQGYLDNGGTVILDSPTSLAKNEYGQPRDLKLSANKGKLISMPDSGDSINTIASIKKSALGIANKNSLGIVLTEQNSAGHKGCTWRVVKQANGSYLMTIVNIGNSTAKLKISTKDGALLASTNLLTSEALGDEFSLISNGVLLIEVNAKE